MPNLFNWVADNAVASVGQTRIFPAQHDCDLSSEALLRAVDDRQTRSLQSSYGEGEAWLYL
jgi:hypothetical protein